METISLNYLELAHLMGIPSKEAKEIFEKHLDIEKVKRSDEIKADDLKQYFGLTISCDHRYDNRNELEFNIEMKKKNYKKHLNKIGFIKKRAFLGGATVFYKICTPEQLQHAKEMFEYKYNFHFKK